MKSRKIWIGRWIVGVALAHTLFGLVVGAKVLADVYARGIYNTVDANPMTGLVVWFLLFGAPLALLGMAVTTLERQDHFPGARSLGVGALLLTVTGVVLMPVSGFWLAFPPAIGLMRR